MSASDEEQLVAMLEAMGVQTIDDSAPPEKDVSQQSPEPASAVTESTIEELLRNSSEQSPSTAAADNAQAAKDTNDRAGVSNVTREVSASAVVHLLGLSTAAQLRVVEDKLDLLSTKVAGLVSKVERIANQVGQAQKENLLDRIDVQLSDIKALLRKSQLVGGTSHHDRDESKDSSPKSAATILTSVPLPGKKGEERVAAPEKTGESRVKEQQFATDADFQASEGERMRQTTNSPKK